MHVFLSMIPPTITQQEHRIGVSKTGKKYTYEQTELKEARSELRAHLSKHAPTQPLTGPVRLVTIWCFPIKGRHKNGEWRTSKPDTDNLNKMLKDVMTSLGFWKDDAQVASESIQKFWTDQPGIYIEWGEMTNGNSTGT